MKEECCTCQQPTSYCEGAALENNMHRTWRRESVCPLWYNDPIPVRKNVQVLPVQHTCHCMKASSKDVNEPKLGKSPELGVFLVSRTLFQELPALPDTTQASAGYQGSNRDANQPNFFTTLREEPSDSAIGWQPPRRRPCSKPDAYKTFVGEALQSTRHLTVTGTQAKTTVHQA